MSVGFSDILAHLHRGGGVGFWCYESVARKPGSDYPQERISWWWDCGTPGPLPDLVGPHGPRHVWFGVHPCSEVPQASASGKPTRREWVRSQVDYINAVNCLYAEFDAKDFGDSKEAAFAHINKLPAAPSVIIDSGGGYHVYWLLRETWRISDDNRADAKALQHAWVAAVGGDLGAKNLNRVLRVPGSVNYKPAYAPEHPEVRIVHARLSTSYTLEQLRKLLPAEALERAEQGDAKPADLDDYARAGALVNMLSTHRRDNYADWLQVGQSLAGLGNAGLAIWDAWSRGGRDYKAGECERKWQGFGENGRTFASLVHWAKEDSPGEFDRLYGQRKHSTHGTGLLAPRADGSEQEINDKLLCKGSSDEGNAQCVYLLYGQQFLYCDAYGWLHWSGTHWERDGAEATLERHIVSALLQRRQAAVRLNNEPTNKAAKPSATNVRSAKFLFRSMVRAGVDSFDANKDLLNCANGTIHLPTGELRPHRQDDRLTYCVKIDLKMDADDGDWLEFLRGVVCGEGDENEEVVQYLQRCAGYSLTGHTSEEVLWYIYGPSRSGKGTFSETLLSILGSPLSTEVDFTTFTRDRDNDASNFDLAPLKPARLVFASESERHQRINAAKVKALTGGNKIQCCFKHKDHFSYRPQYKIWLTSNHPPNADVEDDAIWGRLRVLVFPHSHLGKEDKGLKQRMRERSSLEGVLAWAVRGAGLWYADRDSGLETPGHVVEETARVRVELDTVGQWVEECLRRLYPEDDERAPEDARVTDPGEYHIPNSDLYKNYANWCEENGVAKKQKGGLTRALNRKQIIGPKVKKIMGKSTRVWPGLQFQ